MTLKNPMLSQRNWVQERLYRMIPFIRRSRTGRPIYSENTDQWLPGWGRGAESKGAAGKEPQENWGEQWKCFCLWWWLQWETVVTTH